MKLRTVLIGCLLAIVVTAPAQATLIAYRTLLDGATETPPNASTATGAAQVTYDTVLHTLLVDLNWAGLVGGPATAGHIHCCTAPGTNVGVAVGFVGLPSVTAGTYLHSFDLTAASTYTGAFLSTHGGTAAAAEAALIAGIGAGLAYVNLHDVTFPGGEIRGFLTQAVPEPLTVALIFAGLAAILLSRGRRKA